MTGVAGCWGVGPGCDWRREMEEGINDALSKGDRGRVLFMMAKHGIRESAPGSSSKGYGVRLSVVWCGVVWCRVVSSGVAWCGVVSCSVVSRGVWCGVVWCGVVWCFECVVLILRFRCYRSQILLPRDLEDSARRWSSKVVHRQTAGAIPTCRCLMHCPPYSLTPTQCVGKHCLAHLSLPNRCIDTYVITQPLH